MTIDDYFINFLQIHIPKFGGIELRIINLSIPFRIIQSLREICKFFVQ